MLFRSTLATLLGDGVATRLYQGKEVYAGLPGVRTARSGLVFPSETRTIARISRALATSAPSHPKLPLLRDALVTLGKGDGWGSTTANAEALAALAAWLQAPRDTTWRLDIAEGGKGSTVTPTGGTGVLRTSTAGLAEVKSSAAVGLRVDTRYLPTADGGTVAPVTNGFVVTRTIEVLTDGASEKYPLDKGGTKLDIPKGAVLEDHVQVVVPEDRTYVAIAIPLAAGVEALNPRLATAPPESRPRIATTRAPAWADWRDDEVVYYYDVLPKGTYDLAFRARATVAGDFVLPPATAERLYDLSVVGGSAGARVVVK